MSPVPPVMIMQSLFSQNYYRASVNETSITDGYPPPKDGFLVVECNTTNVTYMITNPDAAGPFNINQRTGSLSAMSIDYEDATIYRFEVSCTSDIDPTLNDSAMVIIDVEPVNEFRPDISQTSITVLVNELTPVGTVLISTIPGEGSYTYMVTDRDAEPDNVITFSLTQLSDTSFTSFLNLNSSTGALSLIRTFDHEGELQTPIALTVTITACDESPPLLTCPNVLVTILIAESNDNLPVFSQNVYNITVSESFPVNEVIATVICTDLDNSIGGFESYHVSGVSPKETPSGTFSIDTRSGNITLLEPLDFEFTTMYGISVTCRDEGGLLDNATVVLTVLDANDNAPNITTFFDDVIDVNDQILVASEILQFRCTDEDSNENGNITYSTVTVSSFTIDAITGNVTVSSSLILPDDVFLMDINFTLQCSDQGDPPLSDYTTVFFQIYKNDSTPPIINDSSISNRLVSISEDAAIGTELVQVMATDTTSPGLMYTLQNENSPEIFIINSTTGVITLAQMLDREMNDTYTFVVVVTEIRVAPGIPESDEAVVRVEVLDVNDNNPEFSQDVYTVKLREDLEAGEMVGTVLCSDMDVGVSDTSIDYEITGGLPEGTFPDTFSINETSGIIILQLPLDYELSPQYTIDVNCSDSGGLEASAAVVVMVMDVNDITPTITTVYDDDILVNDQSQVTFSAIQFDCTDEESNENGIIAYSIDTNDSFAIDNITGDITVSSRLTLPDNVFTREISVTVNCTDQGIPPLSNSSVLSFQIYKDDSTPPVIDRESILNGILSISEAASIGDILAKVQATDTTSPSLQYALTNESSPGVFMINQTTGDITIEEMLDREELEIYTFTVVVTEVRVAPGAEQSDEVDVTVMVRDINDNPPAFSQDVYNVTRLESFPVNETIVIVSCNDLDTSLNGTLRGYEIYSVSPSSVPPGTFSVDDFSGNITLLNPLDFELSRVYIISVLCFDNEGLHDMATVEIYVEDVNDNDPFIETPFNDPILVSDSLPLGYILLQFQCTDVDSGERGTVTYSINTPASQFSIDAIMGSVRVSSSLTLGSGVFIMNHSIAVQCIDQGMPRRSNGTTIVFQIYKDDSTLPVIDMSSISNGVFTISEGRQVNSTLTRVLAFDTTSPGLSYKLLSESSPGAFIIDPNSGIITIAKPLDREIVAQYTFQVVVSEVKVTPFAGPVRRARENVIVMVQDENDNPPVCSHDNITTYVNVGNYTGLNGSLEIARVSCTDLDLGRNAEILIHLTKTPMLSNGRLILNETSGVLQFTGVLSKNGTYPIEVQASDRGIPPLSDTVNITLIVLGESRNDLTSEERLILIIALSVSGVLFLCSCFIILCLCCCCYRREKKYQVTYNLR